MDISVLWLKTIELNITKRFSNCYQEVPWIRQINLYDSTNIFQMINQRYQLALSRSDLSQWLVHFSRSSVQLENIITEGFIHPSKMNHIYSDKGAACFYDSPPSAWNEIINTNPNGRQGFGIIVAKNALWHLGGRPVIYTDNIFQSYWPDSERYRLIYTDLSREPYPADWTHEREWRIKGGLNLSSSDFTGTWWWPVVPSVEYLQNLWKLTQNIVSVYVISRRQVVNR